MSAEAIVCARCDGDLIIPNGSKWQNCPDCGGLDNDKSPAVGINTNIVSLQLRRHLRRYCARHEYAINRVVVELLKMVILEDLDLGDAAKSKQGHNQYTEI